MKIFKTLTTLLLFVISSVSAFSQCSVQKKAESHSTTYFAAFEQIYKNQKDQENGTMEYNLRIALQKDTSKSIPDLYLLECSFISDRIYKEIPPRKIKLVFENGKEILIDARTEESLPNTPAGFIARLYLYQLTPDAVTSMLNLGLSSVWFIDHREKQMITASPYKYILKEQVTCLIAVSSK